MPDNGPEHHVGRRTFVRLLFEGGLFAGGVFAGTFLAGAPGRATARVLRRDAVVPGAASTARVRKEDADGLVALGKEYLETHPREADTAFLVARLRGIDPARDVQRQMPMLTRTITEDFHAGRIVTVKGWQLSRTEARAAAAVALGA